MKVVEDLVLPMPASPKHKLHLSKQALAQLILCGGDLVPAMLFEGFSLGHGSLDCAGAWRLAASLQFSACPVQIPLIWRALDGGGTGAGVFIPQAHFSMTAALQVAQDAKTRVNFQQNLT